MSDVAASTDSFIAKVKKFVVEGKKFVVAATGLVALAVSYGVLPATTAAQVDVILGAITSVLVWLVPNADPVQPAGV